MKLEDLLTEPLTTKESKQEYVLSVKLYSPEGGIQEAIATFVKDSWNEFQPDAKKEALVTIVEACLDELEAEQENV